MPRNPAPPVTRTVCTVFGVVTVVVGVVAVWAILLVLSQCGPHIQHLADRWWAAPKCADVLKRANPRATVHCTCHATVEPPGGRPSPLAPSPVSRARGPGVRAARERDSVRAKAREWLWRYLPAEGVALAGAVVAGLLV